MTIILKHKNLSLSPAQQKIVELIEKTAKESDSYMKFIKTILKQFKDHKLIESPDTVYISYTDPYLFLIKNWVALAIGERGEDFYTIDIIHDTL